MTVAPHRVIGNGAHKATSSALPQVLDYLVSGPFGSRAAIEADLEILYGGIGDLLERTVGIGPPGRPPRDSDPRERIVIRAACNDALDLVPSDPQATRDALRRVHLTCEHGGRQERLVCSPTAFPVVLRGWFENELSRDIARRLQRQFQRDRLSAQVELVEPERWHDDAVRAAFETLMELVPELAVATLPLVDGLVIARSVPRVFEGAHFNAVPCVVLIDESILADRMFAADSVLHEALHQKLCDLSLIRRVLFSPADGEPKVVKIPWGAEVPRCWELSRALAAYHVYVHLAALYAAASSVAPSVIERKTAVERLYRSVWRAAHLDAEVRAHASAALGADGWALCEWLTAAIQMIAEIAAVPPSPYASR